MSIPGYAGQLLRVDLTNQRSWTQPFDSEFARKYVGGAGFGARILYDEVPADVAWDDPDNRLIMATGPMAGSVSWGTSNMCVVTRGPMTNGATSTQANGFFGHCLKFSGYDGSKVEEVRHALHLYEKFYDFAVEAQGFDAARLQREWRDRKIGGSVGVGP